MKHGVIRFRIGQFRHIFFIILDGQKNIYKGKSKVHLKDFSCFIHITLGVVIKFKYMFLIIRTVIKYYQLYNKTKSENVSFESVKYKFQHAT